MWKLLINLFFAFFLAASALADSVVMVGFGAGGSSACSATAYLPTADTNADTWTHSTGSTHYEVVDEHVSSENTADYIYVADNPDTATDTIRFSLPGDCDVTTIRVNMFGWILTGSINVVTDISPDNSTWTSTQNFTMDQVEGSAANQYKDYSVTWSTPSYCYVRFKPGSSTYNNVFIAAMSVKTNP